MIVCVQLPDDKKNCNTVILDAAEEVRGAR